MSAKRQARLEGRLNALFVVLLVALLVLVVVAAVVLAVPPRPVQLWLPALASLLAAAAALAALIPLNQGLNWQRRRSLRLALLAGAGAGLLLAAAVGLTLWGLLGGTADLRLALPLLAALAAALIASVINWTQAAAYQGGMPKRSPQSQSAKYRSGGAAYVNPSMEPAPLGKVHYSRSAQSVSAAPGGQSRASYASSAAPKVETLRPAGSHHSILTMTSDL